MCDLSQIRNVSQAPVYSTRVPWLIWAGPSFGPGEEFPAICTWGTFKRIFIWYCPLDTFFILSYECFSYDRCQQWIKVFFLIRCIINENEDIHQGVSQTSPNSFPPSELAWTGHIHKNVAALVTDGAAVNIKIGTVLNVTRYLISIILKTICFYSRIAQ